MPISIWFYAARAPRFLLTICGLPPRQCRTIGKQALIRLKRASGRKQGLIPAVRNMVPEMFGQIDPALLIHMDPFALQQQLLLLESPADRQGDVPPTVDDPMPGQVVLSGGGMQQPGYLSGSSVIAGTGGDLPVGCDLAAGNVDDRLFGSIAERRFSRKHDPKGTKRLRLPFPFLSETPSG